MKTVSLIFKKCTDKSKGPAAYNWHFLQTTEPAELAQELHLTPGLRFDEYNTPMVKAGWSFTGVEYRGNDRDLLVWNYRQGETDLERLEIMLQGFDWTYDYSDSYAVVQAGEVAHHKIKQLVVKCGPAGHNLYEHYRAKAFGG